MMVNHISCSTSFSILETIPILSPLSTPKAGFPIPTCLIETELTNSDMPMVVYSIIYLVVIPSIWALSGRSIRDCIFEWYMNALSQSCRGVSYRLISHRKSLCGCWISCSTLLRNGEWGYFCDKFIPPSLSITFFHLLLLVISQAWSECIF